MQIGLLIIFLIADQSQILLAQLRKTRSDITEKLLSGRKETNQNLQRKAGVEKFRCSMFWYDTFQLANNKSADQSARMRRLVYAFAVRNSQHRGPYVILYLLAIMLLISAYILNHISNAKSNITFNITYIVSSIVTQFYQKLKHLFMQTKVELHRPTIPF